MQCLKCDNDQFIEEESSFTLFLKGKKVEVEAPCISCTKCRFQLMNTEQMNVLRKAAADKYKELIKLKGKK